MFLTSHNISGDCMLHKFLYFRSNGFICKPNCELLSSFKKFDEVSITHAPEIIRHLLQPLANTLTLSRALET